MIWPALTWSPSSISSSTILSVIFEDTVAWRLATTYPEASNIEPAIAAVPSAIACATARCTAMAEGRDQSQAATSNASNAIAAAAIPMRIPSQVPIRRRDRYAID